MEKYTNKYEVALAIAEKFGSTNVNLSNIFEALKEIAMIKGLSGVYTTKYEILKALALNEGVVGALSNSYECLLELAKIYGGTNFSNNYEAALYLLENAEAGFGGLCFTAVTSGTIGMSHAGTNSTTTIPQLKYSRNGETWTNWNFESLTLNAGDKLYFKGNNPSGIGRASANYSYFVSTGQVIISGNILSIINEDYKGVETLPNYAFRRLFYNFKASEAQRLVLPDFTSTGCYRGMFEGSTIQNGPSLKAKSPVSYAYRDMFLNCSSLKEQPYISMTTLETGVCQQMFKGCSSMKTSQKALLPVKGSISCYRAMYQGCTNLEKAPILYISSLSNIAGCFWEMFDGCSKINEITVYAENWDEAFCENWLRGVSATGTFYNMKSANIPVSIGGIPEGWTEVSPIAVVTIDGTSVRLEKDKSFAQQGYTELYSQNTYAPRLGQSMQDFVYNVNSYPTSGLELFTTCTLAVNMINVTVDGSAQQVNYYTSWAANGFDLLYTNNEFESESDVEEIDVDKTYPNEGDAVYTSYIIVPQWMKQVSTQTGISVTNLKQAEENYTFVDYLQSHGTEWIDTGVYLIDVNKYKAKVQFLDNSKFAVNGAVQNRENTIFTFFDFGLSTIGTIYCRNGKNTSNLINGIPNDKEWHIIESVYNQYSKLDSTTYNVVEKSDTTIREATFNLFARSINDNKGQNFINERLSYFIMSDNKYLIPCLKGTTPIMLDLMTMTEYANQGTGTFAYGDTKSLQEKFNEML